MNKQIIAAVLMVGSCIPSAAYAENRGVATLRVSVTVTPMVQTAAVLPSNAFSSRADGAELNWAPVQQNQTLTKQMPADSLTQTWGEMPGVFGSARMGVSGVRGAQECVITLHTTSFVTQ